MYFAQHSQTGETTDKYFNPTLALEKAFKSGWEECETVLMQGESGNGWLAEFQCIYSWRYGEEFYRCQLASNRPDSYCEVHSA